MLVFEQSEGRVFKSFFSAIKLAIDKLRQYIFTIKFIISKYRINREQRAPSSKLFLFVHEIVAGIRQHVAETRYSKTNQISHFPMRYEMNCSGLINYALEMQFPSALNEVKEFIKATEPDNGKPYIQPLCLYYYKFLHRDQPKIYWETNYAANELSCGDLIIISEDDTKVANRGQHIMVVASEIMPHNAVWSACQVYDSVRYGHASDSRSPDGANGVGEGKIGLRIDNAGKIVEIKWGVSDESTKYSRFTIGRLKNV